MLQGTDFFYPFITRTLLQFFTCRYVGKDADGMDDYYLEADYSVQVSLLSYY